MLPPGSSPPRTPVDKTVTTSLTIQNHQAIESAGGTISQDDATEVKGDRMTRDILGSISVVSDDQMKEPQNEECETIGLRPIRGGHYYTPVTPPQSQTAEYWSTLMQQSSTGSGQQFSSPLPPWPQQSVAWSPIQSNYANDYTQSSFNSLLHQQDTSSPNQVQELMNRMTLQQSGGMGSLAACSPSQQMWSPYGPTMSTAWQQQQNALATHLMASGYAYQYAQMAATAALHTQVQYADALSQQDRYGRGWRLGGQYQQQQQHQAAPYVWTGELPPRNYNDPVFSCKIFVGGCPWDISDQALLNAFKPYGPCRVEWPGKEARYARSVVRPMPRGKVTGYVYMIFDQERSVRSLLTDCSKEFGSGNEYYFKLTAKRMRTKEIRQVQIIPWVISDACHMEKTSQRCDPKKTVFVGALHGMITAEALFNIINDLFGNVVFAGIDTDKYKYPIGSGRVVFGNQRSYFKAIESAFVEIKTSKFTKRVQIDPFLEDAPCSVCDHASGPYFCRHMSCFRYYCRPCWQQQHQMDDKLRMHKPLMRNTRRASPGSEGDESTTEGGTAVQDRDQQQQQEASPTKPFRYSTGGSYNLFARDTYLPNRHLRY